MLGTTRGQSSSPFLRKPLPQMRAERDEPDDGDKKNVPTPITTSSSARPTLPPRKLSAKLSYDAIPNQEVVTAVDQEETNRRIPPITSSRLNENHPNNLTRSPSTTTFTLERHLSLVDLIAVGIGGTIGSGLFVLAGLVANQYAGPSTVLSWIVSGLTACLSGCCYAELSSRIPLAGGAYAYNYVAMGELFAVMAAACLSLEYIAASAAVARSWSDKCLIWLTQDLQVNQDWIHDYFNVQSNFNPLAFVLSCSIVGLLLAGVKESKAATNFFTILKLIVVSTMILGSLYYVRPSNWVPFAPYGVGGIVRGATGTFFGYLGYDQVTALAGEAKNAKRNLPRAIMGVLLAVMALYSCATLFLVGMVPYTKISPVSGFPDAFRQVGAYWIAEFVALGEIMTLPIVILVTIMAQPRLQYAMAVDGLLPSFFGEIDQHGNLWNGTMIAGTTMALVSALVPFEKLNDMISCSVLTVLALTDSSVVMLWHEGPEFNPNLPGQLMFAFHCLALVAGIALANFSDDLLGQIVAAVCLAAMAYTCYAIYRWCPRASTFGGHRPHYHEDALCKDAGYFTTPCVPLLPCIAIFVNWYLIAQLDAMGIGLLLLCLALSVAYYFLYGGHHSVGNNGGWDESPNNIEMEPNKNDKSEQSFSGSFHESTQFTA